MHPNAEANRRDLARGAAYVWGNAQIGAGFCADQISSWFRPQTDSVTAPVYGTYTVTDHAYDRRGAKKDTHPKDEAEVREIVGQVYEWWWDRTSLERQGQDLYAGIAGTISGPVWIVSYNRTFNLVSDVRFWASYAAATAFLESKHFERIASVPIP